MNISSFTESSQTNQANYSSILDSSTYEKVMRKSIENAASSFRIARWFSLILLLCGIGLILTAVILSFIEDTTRNSLLFGSLGTIIIICIFLYRPFDRIQIGLDKLLKSQIVCLSFLAQYDSVARTLTTMSQLPLQETNREEQMKLAKFLQDSASQLINDLNRNGIPGKYPKIEQLSTESKDQLKQPSPRKY